MRRRQLIQLLGLLGLSMTQAESAGAAQEGTRSPWALSDAQWRERLSAKAFEVLRKEGTERPFSSPLAMEKRKGTYECAGCNLPLFSSTTKYDSGTGWPSFWDSFPDALETRLDFRLIVPRTEYHCRRCGGHQGHRFNDGPKPTGYRYCNNGVALIFKPSRA